MSGWSRKDRLEGLARGKEMYLMNNWTWKKSTQVQKKDRKTALRVLIFTVPFTKPKTRKKFRANKNQLLARSSGSGL